MKPQETFRIIIVAKEIENIVDIFTSVKNSEKLKQFASILDQCLTALHRDDFVSKLLQERLTRLSIFSPNDCQK